MSDGWVLVAGYGSIGRRHFRNLRALGREDVRLLRSGRTPPEGFETPPDTPVYHDLDEALEQGPGVVVVANPTALHARVVQAAVDAGACVLLEKPVCSDLEEARSLKEGVDRTGGVCGMAYCFRYHPLYREMKEVVDRGLLGRVFHAHTWQASYLPDWHPWEDWRTGYAVRPELGGGVVHTLDHDLDFLRWTLGQPREVLAAAGPLSGLEVTVEDTADMIFRFPDRLQAHAHVCFARRDYARGAWLVGEKASARLDWGDGALTVHDGKDIVHELRLEEDFDLNRIYLSMLRDALEGFERESPVAAVPLGDGVAALEMAEGALASAAEGRAVSLEHTTTPT